MSNGIPILLGEYMAKITDIEKEQWDKLYQYVKKDILGYDNKQSLPKDFIFRLKGLAKGQFIINNSHESYADYSYEIILFTFQSCKLTILNALQTKTFNNENAKFNYICKIVENNINDIYLRVKNIKKSEESVSNINTDVQLHKSTSYKRQTEDVKNKRLDDLW